MYYSTRDEMVTETIRSLDLKMGIEVGVRDGNFSRHILKTTPIKFLYGLDIEIRPTAKRLEAEFPGRYKLYKGRSPEFASNFPDEIMDFIHIDAGHGYEDVKKDLQGWWPKLKSGGIFSGDDYDDVDNPAEGRYGVIQAVNEFMEQHSLEFYVTGVKTTDLAAKIAWAKLNGEQGSKYLRNMPHKPFVNPAWYCVKP